MAFGRRRGSSLHPVNSTKHVIDTGGGLTSSVSTVTIATAVANYADPFVANQVKFGEKINAVFFSIFVIGATGSGLTGPIDWYFSKRHSGQLLSALPDPGETGQSMVRNQILHEEKGLSGSADGTPMAFKGVLMVPKGIRRMREGDNLEIRLKMTDPDSGIFCVKAIYKSFA